MDYETYDALSATIREQNNQYLSIFEDDLEAANLKPKTINKHLANVDFYINTYLLNYEPLEMSAGCGYEIHNFLGDFFIRKAMWSTPASIKSTAASIKKYYKSMMDHGHVNKESYTNLCDEIEENMTDWQAECEAYNNFDDFDGLDW